MRTGELRVSRDGLLKVRDGAGEPSRVPQQEVVAPVQVQLVRCLVGGATCGVRRRVLPALRHAAAERGRERGDDGMRERVLYCEDIARAALEDAVPEHLSVAGAHELCGYAEAVASPPHRAADVGGDIEHPADLL